jgi:hypothetical protein
VTQWVNAQSSASDFCVLQPSFGAVSFYTCPGADIAQLGGVDTSVTYYYDPVSGELVGIARDRVPNAPVPIAGRSPSIDVSTCALLSSVTCN